MCSGGIVHTSAQMCTHICRYCQFTSHEFIVKCVQCCAEYIWIHASCTTLMCTLYTVQLVAKSARCVGTCCTSEGWKASWWHLLLSSSQLCLLRFVRLVQLHLSCYYSDVYSDSLDCSNTTIFTL